MRGHVAILVNDRRRAERLSRPLRRVGLRLRCGRGGRSYPSSRLPFAPTATAVQAARGGGKAGPRRGAGVGVGREAAERQPNGRRVGYEGSRAAGERSCCYGSARKLRRVPGSLSAKHQRPKRETANEHVRLVVGDSPAGAGCVVSRSCAQLAHSTPRTARERQRACRHSCNTLPFAALAGHRDTATAFYHTPAR